MADISGLIVTVLGLSFELTSSLYNYARSVKSAKDDIKKLSTELFALIGALDHINRQEIQNSSIGHSDAVARLPHRDNVRHVLDECLGFLTELHKALVIPKGQIEAKKYKMLWPFKESQTRQHIERLERVKTYFILSLVTDEIDLTRQVESQICALSTFVKNDVENRKNEDSGRKYKQVMTWLSSVDSTSLRQKIAGLRTPGSGAWFTQSKIFRVWSESPSNSTFWVNGITGAGKSTLITTALEWISSRKAGSAQIAYFYCSFADKESLEPLNILGSILAQLCKPSAPIYEKVEALYDEMSKNNSTTTRKLSTDELVALIVEQISYETTYIFVDGINECEDCFDILKSLKTTARSSGLVRIFLSCINEKDIQASLQEFPDLFTLTLRPIDIISDIRLLVQANLDSHPRLCHHSPALKTEITHALTEGAQGMFRWVYCQLDLLSRLRTPGAVKSALTSLPRTLDKTYEGLLSRIDGVEDRRLTREILNILAFSFRSLHLREICEVLQITPGTRRLDESKRLTDPNDVLSICGSLLSYNPKTQTVALAHHSVKTYLVSDLVGDVSYFKLSEHEGHRSLAINCISYLLLDSFSSGPCLSIPMLDFRRRKFPFLSYASEYWPIHARKLEDLGDVGSHFLNAVKSLLASTGNFRAWVELLIPDSCNIEDTPPLYYPASYGLTTVVRYLLQAGADMEAPGGRARATPINIASYRGNTETVKLLLEHGANPWAEDDACMNAVEWAQLEGHHDINRIFSELIRKDGRAEYSTLLNPAYSFKTRKNERRTFRRLS